MTENVQPTIFALSSAWGRAAVAVVRISGPRAGAALAAMAGALPPARTAVLRRLRHPESRELLDSALVLWFPGPASETGEDLAELQVHGGPAVVKAVLQALSAVPGLRTAEAGEFARRAFESGKLDLAEVEGLADLIDAQTEAQRRQALRQAGGALSALYEDWRASLLEAAALVEAAIDFADEGDVGRATVAEARRGVAGLLASIRAHLDDGSRGEILRQGFRVTLSGPPNAGKSSLLNALTRRDAAIVSEEAGTTRDVIEVLLDLDGLPIILSDTAGIRAAEGRVEEEGIRRSLASAQAADLVLWLTEAGGPPASAPPDWSGRKDQLLPVMSKIDLLPDDARPAPGWLGLAVSAKTGEGIAELAARLAGIARERMALGEEPAITQERQRRLVSGCAEALAAFLDGDPAALELRAEDLRRAAAALGRVTGRVGAEEVLDQIFRRFCVGK